MSGTHPTQYFHFLTLCLWALHEKNRLQKAFDPLNIRRVAELLPVDKICKASAKEFSLGGDFQLSTLLVIIIF